MNKCYKIARQQIIFLTLLSIYTVCVLMRNCTSHSVTLTYFSVLGASCSPLYLQSDSTFELKSSMSSCHVCLFTLLCRRATVIPDSLECTFIYQTLKTLWRYLTYLIYMYRNITCSNVVFILSQGHPGLGVCSSGSFPGEELRDFHLTVGRPHGGAVTLCRAQCHPGQYGVKAVQSGSIQGQQVTFCTLSLEPAHQTAHRPSKGLTDFTFQTFALVVTCKSIF